MTSIQLYKFIYDNQFEYHWHDENVILFIHIGWIKEWNELLVESIMEEEGIPCTMKTGYFCFWMKGICDHFDIEMKEVFTDTEH